MCFWGDWGLIATAVKRLPLSLWGFILSLSLANYLTRFLRWKLYISQLHGDVVIPAWTHLRIYFAGFALTTTPGKAGELVRSLYLVEHDIDLESSFSAFFVERTVDLLAILLLSLVCGFAIWEYGLAVLAVTVGGVLLFLLLLLQQKTLWNKLQRARFRPRRVSLLLNKLAATLVFSRRLLSWRVFILGLLVGVFAWGAEGLALYYITQALKLNVGLLAAVGIYCVSVLFGALSFVPGGLGSTEAMMGALLIALGVNSSEALVVTLVCRVSTLWFAVMIGVFAVFSLRKWPINWSSRQIANIRKPYSSLKKG